MRGIERSVAPPRNNGPSLSKAVVSRLFLSYLGDMVPGIMRPKPILLVGREEPVQASGVAANKGVHRAVRIDRLLVEGVLAVQAVGRGTDQVGDPLLEALVGSR